MRRNCIAIAVAFTLLDPLKAFPQELWTSKDGSIRNIDTRAIYADDQKTYLATKTELYASSTPKGKWESIFFIPSGDNEIACIGGNSGNLFVGTRRGLFRSHDLGRTWLNVFKMIIPEKSRVLAIQTLSGNPDRVIIGTDRGLFVSDDGGAGWRDTGPALKNRRVKSVAFNSAQIFAGTDDGLYLADAALGNWQRVFAYNNASDDVYPAEEASDPTEPEERADPGINCIAIKGAKIYIAFGRKISYSNDTAKSWKDFSSAGLSGSVNSILVAERSDKLYCATTKGVFEYNLEKNSWNELYKGRPQASNVRKIAFADKEERTLWAGTEKGVYRFETGGYTVNSYMDVGKDLKVVRAIFDGEPSFKELQEAAIKFNDLDPDKIRKWHFESRMRALAPKVSVGFDNSTSNNYNIVAAATVPDRDRVVIGPDDVNEGFDLSVSWDLANIIWSDDQANIDVRSRLTTQLRSDILDDLRRAYFERKRMQYEMAVSPPAETKLRFEKELRILELTQTIDDITGNYLTEYQKTK